MDLEFASLDKESVNRLCFLVEGSVYKLSLSLTRSQALSTQFLSRKYKDYSHNISVPRFSERMDTYSWQLAIRGIVLKAGFLFSQRDRFPCIPYLNVLR